MEIIVHIYNLVELMRYRYVNIYLIVCALRLSLIAQACIEPLVYYVAYVSILNYYSCAVLFIFSFIHFEICMSQNWDHRKTKNLK